LNVVFDRGDGALVLFALKAANPTGVSGRGE
jgi:hypothetical protein